MDISQLRKEYLSKKFSKSDLAEHPIMQLNNWLQDAIASEIEEPNAMVLATSTKEGKPSSRTVLLKEYSNEGLVFFTNSKSRKSLELFENPYASVTFLWKEIERQVVIEGLAEEASRSVTDAYFSKRPRESQIGAWASRQDAVLDSREQLIKAYLDYEKEFEGLPVSTPPFWTGFRIIPERFEFWQGRPNRLHDRFAYTLENGKWVAFRLSP